MEKKPVNGNWKMGTAERRGEVPLAQFGLRFALAPESAPAPVSLTLPSGNDRLDAVARLARLQASG